LRAQVRGAAGIVTDGGIRDSVRLAGMGAPQRHPPLHLRLRPEPRARLGMIEAGAPAASVETFTREHRMRTVEAFQQWRAAQEPERPPG